MPDSSSGVSSSGIHHGDVFLASTPCHLRSFATWLECSESWRSDSATAPDLFRLVAPGSGSTTRWHSCLSDHLVVTLFRRLIAKQRGE